MSSGGHIDRIEVQDFKSYAGKQTIGPFKEFSAVIGPNGAGKSNLMDAICFVLGLSARHLRGNQLQDLIHRPESRGGSTSRPKKAFVSLIFVVGDEAIGDFEPRSEVAFSRHILRGGQSQYRLNGRDLPWSEYDATLARIGVLTRARNFLVFQGDVENIANKSPKKLLEFFEVVSGSQELKQPYEAAEARLHDAETEYRFAQQKVKSLRSERKAMKEEKDEAIRFQEMQHEETELSTQLALWNLWHVEQSVREGEKELASLTSQLDECKESEGNGTERFREAVAAHRAAQRRLTKAEKQVHSLQRQAQEKATAVTEARAATETRTRQQQLQHEEEAKARKLLEETQATVRKLEQDIADVEEGLREMEHDEGAGAGGGMEDDDGGDDDDDDDRDAGGAAAASSSRRKQRRANKAPSRPRRSSGGVVTLQSSQLHEYRAKKAEVRQRTVDEQSELVTARQRRDAARSRLQAVQSERADHARRQKELAQELEELRSRHSLFSNALEKLTGERAAKVDSLTRLEQTIARDQGRQEELAAELQDVKQRMDAAKSAQQESETERRMAETIGDMQRMYTGVFGRLVDLVEPVQRRFSIALDVGLGRYADAIVVDTAATAKECMELLRERRVRPCTFLPLDNLEVEPADDALEALGGGFRMLRTLVRFDNKVETAVNFACGNTVFSESLDDAMALRFDRGVSCRVVTVDGSVIAKSGNLTGGITVAEERRANRFSEKEMQKVRQRRDELLQEEATLRRRLGRGGGASASASVLREAEDLRTTIRTQENKEKTMRADLEQVASNIEARGQALQAVEEALEEIRVREAAAREELEDLQASVETLESQIREVEDEVFAPLVESLGLASIREYEQTVVVGEEEREQRIRKRKEHIRALKEKLEYDRSREERARKSLASTRLAASASLPAGQGTTLSVEDAEAEHQAAAERVAAAETTVQELSEETKRTEAALAEARATKTQTAHRRAAVARQVANQETEVEKQRARRHEMLQQLRLEQVRLPMVGKSEPVVPPIALTQTQSQSQSSSATSSSSQATKRRSPHQQRRRSTRTMEDDEDDSQSTDEDEAMAEQIDFSALDASLPKDTQDPRVIEETAADLEERISRLRTQIEQAQPNLKAADQYEDVTKRLEEQNQHMNAKREASEEAAAEFATLRHDRTHRFLTTFRAVEREISRVYEKLTYSRRFKDQGRARLFLYNEEDPFNGEGVRYSALPPAKKFRDMDRLSGGERTVAALALLFAIHVHQPSPFFIMDEVDAALDNANVRKVVRYIHRRAHGYRPSEHGPPVQCIVISLKDSFFGQADSLVGIYRETTRDCSGTLTLDLTQYAHRPVGGGSGGGSRDSVASRTPRSVQEDAQSEAATPERAERHKAVRRAGRRVAEALAAEPGMQPAGGDNLEEGEQESPAPKRRSKGPTKKKKNKKKSGNV